MSERPLIHPAELVAGRFRLVRRIGRGGMGSVWEAADIATGGCAAVKFIESDVPDDETRAAFENEAQATARLRSPYIVAVLDHGVTEDGRPFLVMEHLHGESLEHRLSRVGRLTVPHTADLLSQVCRGLAEAHEAGIVHRDLKPENIFLCTANDGAERAKVVDFGMAIFLRPGDRRPTSPDACAMLGTPCYMSPEQARGLGSVDHRADLWALGVVAYRCVVGRVPFDGPSVGDLLVRICTEEPELPSTANPALSRAFDAWFLKAAAREPQSRFSSAQELAAALCRVADQDRKDGGGVEPCCGTRDSVGAPSNPSRDDVRHPSVRRPRSNGNGTTVIVLVAGTLVLAAVGVMAWRIAHAPSKSEAEPGASARP